MCSIRIGLDASIMLDFQKNCQGYESFYLGFDPGTEPFALREY